jgi:TRAP-type C4-dicarboxylate transport system substrate-binding protein
MTDLKHRSGPTDILLKTWREIGSSPNTIAWGETPAALDEGAADSAYVAIQAWRVFGFDDIISHVSFVNMVEDAQMYSVNEEWFQSLSSDLQDAVITAGQKSMEDNLNALMASRKNSVDRLRESGVQFHELSKSEQDEWMNTVGYQNTDLWQDEIEKSVGGIDRFNRLVEAARSESDVTVPDHSDEAYRFGIREEGDAQNSNN